MTVKIRRDNLSLLKRERFCSLFITILFKLNFMTFLAFAEGASVQLLPDATLLIHIALILIMIWILNRTFFRPINRVIEARVKNKGGRFTEAEEILNQVSQKRAAYEESLLKARTEGYEMVEKERAEAVRQREAEISRVKEEVSQVFVQEKEELDRQTAQARQQIAQEAKVMADRISANILNGAG